MIIFEYDFVSLFLNGQRHSLRCYQIILAALKFTSLFYLGDDWQKPLFSLKISLELRIFRQQIYL